MFDKGGVIAELVEEKLPLFTPKIREALAEINRGPPDPSHLAVLEVIKRYPDHFADYIFYRTNGHKLDGEIVWTNPDTDHDFHDVDIEIVCRYLRTAYAIEDRLSNMPQAVVLLKMERHAEVKRKRDLEIGEVEDEQRYFSLPSARASDDCWLYWKELPHLTSDECAALAMGLDPNLVSLSKVEAAVGVGRSAFLERFRNTKRVFERGVKKNGPDDAAISFLKFKELLKKNNITPSSAPMARAIGSAFSGVDSNEISTAAVHSLYKIALALALKQYPDLSKEINVIDASQSTDKKKPTSVFTQMEKDLRLIMPKINDGTLKLYLGRAYSYARSEKLLAPV